MRLDFDFIDAAGHAAPRRYARPARVVVARTLDDVLPAMREVEVGVRDGLHAAGFVSYEAAPAFDAALVTRPPSSLPLLWFGLFAEPSTPDAGTRASEPMPHVTWTPDIAVTEHQAGVVEVRDAIARGDSYQANYTFRLHGQIPPSASHALYSRLLRDQRPPYAAFIDIGAWQLLSLSPELFFRVDGRRISTRPMKGTAPRGLWNDDDEAQAAWLHGSEKNRAENVMIVDLSRNDLSRIAEIGSVCARELFVVERYPTLFQMVSDVEGVLRQDVSVADLFAALFPAGSVTGAPKTSSMKLIASIETTSRDIYCGAMGYITPTGQAVFNVAIRTAAIDVATGHAAYGVGGGITWDSAPADEYAEAIAKSECLVPREPFDLIETMRFDGTHYVRLDRHLRRIRASARYFDFAYDPAAIDRVLADHANRHQGTSRRVRLHLEQGGHAEVESRPLESPSAGPRPVALARTAVDRRDRFLFHKTTRRVVYDAHRASHPDVFDVLLWNQDNELTEFTIGNLVVEFDGERRTPPREAGLLPGTFREELLETGQISERVVTRADLARATRLWLVNSLREWVEVRLEESPRR